ncbi:MAG: DUF1385 domain-containing protein [Hespellia sp.]|nr:DUF1385 domain-containing protein [Hespellia sp.]
MKSSNIGGQAVLEGIMMRNQGRYAVAVRKPDQTIALDIEEYKSIVPWKAVTKIPFVRGMFNFVDSMVLGLKTLTFSASFFEDEEESGQTEKEPVDAKKMERQEKLMMGGTVAFSLILAILLFTVLPSFLAGILKRYFHGYTMRAVMEGGLKAVIFIGYLLLISRMKDIQRVFMYHGAEHKCINCIEHGLELTVDNVRASSKQHKRCGTSFLLFVIVLSIIVGLFIRVDATWLRVLIRIALLPLVAGVSYEIIKLAGNSDNPIISILSKPGLWTQNLTTREPEDDMIEVAITAVEAVFDWRAYLAGADLADCKVTSPLTSEAEGLS